MLLVLLRLPRHRLSQSTRRRLGVELQLPSWQRCKERRRFLEGAVLRPGR